MSKSERPLSPHISIYRWPITMLLSILHRATGLAMAVGLVVFALWLSNAAAGASAYTEFSELMSTLVGRLLLIGWSFAFFFHLANGIRHLFWDVGRGLERHQANASAWFVLLTAIILSAALWTMLL